MSKETSKNPQWITTTSTPWGVLKTISEIDFSTSSESLPEVLANFEKAKNKLNEYVENLPIRADLNTKQRLNWAAEWDNAERKYGDNSLRSLFPRVVDRDTKSIARLLQSLSRKNNIETKTELLEIKPDYPQLRQIGEKGKVILDLILGVITAESKMKDWEDNNK